MEKNKIEELRTRILKEISETNALDIIKLGANPEVSE